MSLKKLIIQIPCYNEEKTLGLTLSELPKQVSGFDTVEWLIIDDGSRDQTVEVAKASGVNHIVSHSTNLGLAKAFMSGLDACISLGADVIINTDADNQYCADDIPKLVEPILTGESEIVIGARPISAIKHFSLAKKILQKIGSYTVRIASNTNVIDAPSGFRAITRFAAMRLNVFNNYTYTLETIIQAGHQGIAVTSVPIRVNGKTRPSRLVKSIASYLQKSALTIIRIFVTYKPFRFFVIPSIIIGLCGLIINLRFLYFYSIGEGNGHIQSLILAAVLIGIAFLLCITGLLSDLISVNRKLLEKMNLQIRILQDTLKSVQDKLD